MSNYCKRCEQTTLLIIACDVGSVSESGHPACKEVPAQRGSGEETNSSTNGTTKGISSRSYIAMDIQLLLVPIAPLSLIVEHITDTCYLHT